MSKFTDFFKKTWNYLKQKVAKIGEFFVALVGEKVLPAMLPITSQIAFKKGMVSPAGVHWLASSEDTKFSGASTNPKTILATRPSTIEAWKAAARNKGIKESYENKTIDIA